MADLDLLFREAERRANAREQLAASRPRPLRIPSRHGWLLFIHPDLNNAGGWRVTRFEQDEPVGHIECGDFAGAVREACAFGGQLELVEEVTRG